MKTVLIFVWGVKILMAVGQNLRYGTLWRFANSLVGSTSFQEVGEESYSKLPTRSVPE